MAPNFFSKQKLFWQMWAVFYLIAALICLADLVDGTSFVKDVDDLMREIQIRNLLFGQNSWFDLKFDFVQMPEPYISPWSRVVDLPYFTIAQIFAPLVGPERALNFAFIVWPPMMLIIFCGLSLAALIKIAENLNLTRTAYLSSIFFAPVLMTIGIYEFEPTRIDHHNLQVICLSAILFGLIKWNTSGGIIIGFASAVSILVGLEVVPLIVICYAGIALVFVAGYEGSRVVLLASCWTLLSTAFIGSAIFSGPSIVFDNSCDAFSLVYLYIVSGSCLALIIGANLPSNLNTWQLRLLTLSLLAILVVASAAILFPICLDGPYHMIDPIAREYWFNRIPQEHSFIHFFQEQNYGIITMIVFWLIILIVAAWPISLRLKQKPGVAIAYTMALITLFLTLIVTRYISFSAAIVPLFLPYVFAGALSSTYRNWSLRITGVVIAVFVSIWALLPINPPKLDQIDYMKIVECDNSNYSILESLPAGRVLLPQGQAIDFVRHAPKRFSVSNINFHRASAGMTRAFNAFLTQDARIRREMLAPYDYVAVCMLPAGLVQSDDTLYGALTNGRSWSGLERLTPIEAQLQFFKIHHQRLE